MDIIQTLQSMLKKTVDIQNMDVSQQEKDNARNVMNQSLNIIIEQLSPNKINQITLQELRKNRRETIQQ